MIQQLIKTDSVPWIWASEFDNSDECYLSTYKLLGRDKEVIGDTLRKKFPNKQITVCEDLSLRGYYIFVGGTCAR